MGIVKIKMLTETSALSSEVLASRLATELTCGGVTAVAIESAVVTGSNVDVETLCGMFNCISETVTQYDINELNEGNHGKFGHS